MIGLSGLLVKSAQQMVLTAQDLQAGRHRCPDSRRRSGADPQIYEHAHRTGIRRLGAVCEGCDGWTGTGESLDESGGASATGGRAAQGEEMADVQGSGRAAAAAKSAAPVRSNVSQDVEVMVPPDLDRHILRDYPVEYLRPYVNMQMLLGHHLGLKGKVSRLLEEGDEKALQLKQLVDGIYEEATRLGVLKPQGMYQFFPAQSEGNTIYIYDPADHSKVLQTFTFPRQQVEPYLCLADFIRSRESGEMDYVGFLVVTCGHGIMELAEQWKEQGDYLKSHALQSIALETAEAFAERIHHIMRDAWGFRIPSI